MSLYAKNLRHARWYFISKPLPDNSPPAGIHVHALSLVYHYSECPALQGYNIILGYVQLDSRLNPDELERISGRWYQWIPAVFAHQFT